MRILCNLPLDCFDERANLRDVELVTFGPPDRLLVDGVQFPYDVAFEMLPVAPDLDGRGGMDDNLPSLKCILPNVDISQRATNSCRTQGSEYGVGSRRA